MISVADARYAAGNWNLYVKRTGDFAANNNDKFKGVLVLNDGLVEHSGGPEFITDSVKIAKNIIVGKDNNTVVTIGDEQKAGTYFVKWLRSYITLDLTAYEAAKLIVDAEYIEELTWTLEAE